MPMPSVSDSTLVNFACLAIPPALNI
jgi:hypothetical protein